MRILSCYIRISKYAWTRAGGLTNPRCLRVAKGRSWVYYYDPR